MKWEQIQNRLRGLADRVGAQFTHLNEDDLRRFYAKKEDLLGKIQERYGVAREEAQQRLDQWMRRAHNWLKKA